MRTQVKRDDRAALLRLQAGLGDDVLAGTEVVGAGYDVFGGGASVDYVTTAKIIDWSKAEFNTFDFRGTVYRKPEILTVLTVDTSDIVMITGDSVQSYQSNLATSVSIEGSYNFFSGSLVAEFSEQTLRTASSSFSKAKQTIALWSMSLLVDPANNQKIRDLLYNDFKMRLDNLDTNNQTDCEAFFDAYGSHILTGLVEGGAASRSSSTNKNTVDKSYDLSVTAKESYKAVTLQATASEKVQYGNSVSSFEATSQTREFVVGGDPTLGSEVFSEEEVAPGEEIPFVKWRSTVAAAPAFIEFTRQKPLTPIWYLCEPSKVGKLPEFFAIWATTQSQDYTYGPEYVDALTVVTGDNSNISPTPGYEKISYDLNAGAGGDFIYLCFHKQRVSPRNNPAAITDLRVIYDNDGVPEGFTKIDIDLNKGAGGAYVYLCYKKQSYEAGAAILSVTVIGGNDSNVSPPYGYTKVAGDLNAGSGGQFVYFCYSKTS